MADMYRDWLERQPTEPPPTIAQTIAAQPANRYPATRVFRLAAVSPATTPETAPAKFPDRPTAVDSFAAMGQSERDELTAAAIRSRPWAAHKYAAEAARFHSGGTTGTMPPTRPRERRPVPHRRAGRGRHSARAPGESDGPSDARRAGIGARPLDTTKPTAAKDSAPSDRAAILDGGYVRSYATRRDPDEPLWVTLGGAYARRWRGKSSARKNTRNVWIWGAYRRPGRSPIAILPPAPPPGWAVAEYPGPGHWIGLASEGTDRNGDPIMFLLSPRGDNEWATWKVLANGVRRISGGTLPLREAVNLCQSLSLSPVEPPRHPRRIDRKAILGRAA